MSGFGGAISITPFLFFCDELRFGPSLDEGIFLLACNCEQDDYYKQPNEEMHGLKGYLGLMHAMLKWEWINHSCLHCDVGYHLWKYIFNKCGLAWCLLGSLEKLVEAWRLGVSWVQDFGFGG